MIELARRSFLTGLGAALIAAPAIVRAGSLMPVKAMKPTDEMLALLARRIEKAEAIFAKNFAQMIWGDIQYGSRSAALLGLKTDQEISEAKALGVLFPFMQRTSEIILRA